MFGNRFTIPMHAIKKAPPQWEQRNTGRQLPGKRQFLGTDFLPVGAKHLTKAVSGGYAKAAAEVGDRALARVEGQRGEELAANVAREKKRTRAALKKQLRTLKGLQAIDTAWAQYSMQHVPHMWQFGGTMRARGGLNSNITSAHIAPAASTRNRWVPSFQQRHLPGVPSGIDAVKIDEGTTKVFTRPRGTDPLYRSAYGTQLFQASSYSSPKDFTESGKAITPNGWRADPGRTMMDYSINSNIQKHLTKVMHNHNGSFAHMTGTFGTKTKARVRFWRQMLEQDVPRDHSMVAKHIYRRRGSCSDREQQGLRFAVSAHASPRSVGYQVLRADRATSSFHSADGRHSLTRMQERPGL